MSMSTQIYGIVPADDKYQKMKAVYDACVEADTEIPELVLDFFDDGTPDEKGMTISITEAVSNHLKDMEQGYEVDLSLLPVKVKMIRFVNSW